MIAALFAVVLLVSSAVGQNFASTRIDDDQGPYLEAFLSWQSGVGTLSWTRAEGEDAGGPGADVDRDVWVSSPLAREYRINASRYIEVNVFTKGVPSHEADGTSCHTNTVKMNATLLVDDVVVGDAVGPQNFGLRSGTKRVPFPFEPDPPGFGVCRLRLAAQRDLLERGSVLKLVIGHNVAHPNNGGTFATAFPPYGLAGSHASVVRIPVFSPEEQPYRYPTYAHGAPEVPGAGQLVQRVATGAGLAGLTLAAGLSPLRPRARRGVALLAAAVVLLSSLGGCLGHASNSATGAPVENGVISTIVPGYQHGNLSRPGLGAMIGQVVAGDTYQPVHGGFVALVGTANASKTDPYGRFVFRDLPPTTYRIRVDHAGYAPFEASVSVVADLITQVNLTLVPVGATGAGERPHAHDYWLGKAEITLMEKVRLGMGTNGNPCTPAIDTCAAGGGVGAVAAFLIPSDPDGFNTILPGTSDVNVTVDWDPVFVNCGRYGLVWQDNHDPSLDNWTKASPRPNGASVHIATTWEMTDPGHQRFSSWVFQVLCWAPAQGGWDENFADVDPTKPGEKQWTIIEHNNARFLQPERTGFNVTVKIRKTTVPYEPAHPDAWHGSSKIRALDGPALPANTTAAGAATSPPQEWVLRQGLDPARLDPTLGHWNLAWRPVFMVAPETMWLEVYANASRDLLPSYDVEFRYKTAQSPLSATCLQSGLAFGSEGAGGRYCDGPGYATAAPGTTNGRSTRWIVPVGPDEADPFYVQRSFWMFGLKPAGDVANLNKDVADATAHGGAGGVAAEPLTYTLTVIAHRDAAPA